MIREYPLKVVVRDAGSNGLVCVVKHKISENQAVMKIAMNLVTSGSLYWESDVLERIIGGIDFEDRSRHLVRRFDFGHTINMDKEKVAYIVMENLPGNPVTVISTLTGNRAVIKVAEFGLQLLKAIYDFHYLGFVHRDIKPENIGLHGSEILVLYDMGMARFYTETDGRARQPRCHVGMRGTEEWASLTAELGRDQGRIDDLWGWFYVLIEWMNCCSKFPLCWAPFEDVADLRRLCKSSIFPAKYVLRNCPLQFYKIRCYLLSLGRDDTPNYFYLASLLQNVRAKFSERLSVDQQAPESEDERAEQFSMLEHEH